LEIITSKFDLTEFLSNVRKNNKSVGFVPTMGALHAGHLSLIKIAKELTDFVVCSIFVNPTQFTNLNDLENYPRPIEEDVKLLEASGCDVLFLPAVTEMYGENEEWKFEVGYLENILEGKFRAGHYRGVTQIVKKLLDAVNPDYMFLGQKDYQQVMVLDHMVKSLNIPSELVMCPIVREDDGLALSSRNIHLTTADRQNALVLFQALFQAKEHFQKLSITQLKSEAWSKLVNTQGITPEYFEICDAATLLPVESKSAESIIALVAAKVGNTRLIDNIILK
jgi:pantoate--beta-alanine ligase